MNSSHHLFLLPTPLSIKSKHFKSNKQRRYGRVCGYLAVSPTSVLLQQERKLLGVTGREAEYNRGEMGEMMAFLRVADAKEDGDPQLKDWWLGKESSHLNKEFENQTKIVSEMQTIRARVEKASKSQQAYRNMYPVMLQGSTSILPGTEDQATAQVLEEVDIMGIEKLKKQLAEWLLSTDFGPQVISVVGMAGSGKTTLVKNVFYDAAVHMNFDHHLWLNVAKSFKAEQFLRDMIKQLLNEVKQPPIEGLESMDADEMKEFVYIFLQHKRYIVVLDDVCKIYAWEAIKHAFPKGACGRIIIITHFHQIGNAACGGSNGLVYNLEPLPAQESKKLFYGKAFQRNESCPPQLKEISESILKRCEGRPLPIVAIGSLLATKNNRTEEWEMFNSSLQGRSVAGESYSNSSVDSRRICGGKKGKSMEEVADGYLNELLNRSLIQVAETSRDGRPRNFQIQELIVSKAREQNIVAVNNQEEIRWPHRVQRLALHSSINGIPPVCSFDYLRSLLFLGPVDLECLLTILDKGGGFSKAQNFGPRGVGRTETGEAVRVEKGSMPRLHELVVIGCRMMAEMPAGIDHLLNLQHVGLVDMAEEYGGGEKKLAQVHQVVVVDTVDADFRQRQC
ncbi:Disease resistance protein RPM1 [Sesamum angolense]|uniref:Disease resistance protein RPM1 n=1 Tax=Sesamum angolense TaxID=2727404 RepID=A0AAE1W9B6_9LAMI|nr:Disease resistance protein RPM1 [Sesamum angolense]